MTARDTFQRYVALVDVTEPTAQNVQELATLWGQLDAELEEVGVEVEQSYAVLGEIDFLIVFAAPDDETAFQADVIIQRHGLDVQSMEITATERFSELVGEL